MSNLFADDRYDLDPADVAARLARGEVQLVDIRETYEHTAGHVPGARHLEIERLAWNAESISRDVPVVFHCRLGVRAAMAGHAFRSIGYEAYNMRGGFAAWAEAGLPMEPEGAVVADH